ncbi:MAG: MarR family transcriptional regulator [Candidatus Nanopelagicales bacterium]|nr:MarR family transcriptional regulator [Candidatus Nanopelagicales bacterium]
MPDADLVQIDEALMGLRHLWSTPDRLSDSRLGEVELSTMWIADALTRMADRREVSVADLADALDVAHSTASRLLNRAESVGVIERRPSRTDARRVTVRLTRRGRSLARAGTAFRTDFLGQAMRDWNAADRLRFAELLARFVEVTRDQPRITHDHTTAERG